MTKDFDMTDTTQQDMLKAALHHIEDELNSLSAAPKQEPSVEEKWDAALQELADIAQENDMGYGNAQVSEGALSQLAQNVGNIELERARAERDRAIRALESALAAQKQEPSNEQLLTELENARRIICYLSGVLYHISDLNGGHDLTDAKLMCDEAINHIAKKA